jgi:protein-disulfide isomerase
VGTNNQPAKPTTRRDRRAAARDDRFSSSRDERRARAAKAGESRGSRLNTTTIMLGAIAIGVLIVAVVALNQLGPRATGSLGDPSIEYPAALLQAKAVGNADAPVTLEVWEDFQCPVCARHSLSVEPILVERYVKPGTLRIVHHDLAFLGRGTPDESEVAGSGAVCANRQGKYWDYSHWIYNNQDGENAGGFRPERVKTIAETAGLDVSGWDACMADPAVLAEVRGSTQEGVGLGVNSTPTMLINGTRVDPPGLKSADELGTLIEQAATAGVSAAP